MHLAVCAVEARLVDDSRLFVGPHERRAAPQPHAAVEPVLGEGAVIDQPVLLDPELINPLLLQALGLDPFEHQGLKQVHDQYARTEADDGGNQRVAHRERRVRDVRGQYQPVDDVLDDDDPAIAHFALGRQAN